MIEFLNKLLSDYTELIKLGAFAAAITLVVFVAIKTKGSWPAILMSIVTGGLVIWAVTMNGLGWFAEKADDETNASSSISSVIEATPAVADDEAPSYILVS